MLVKPCISSTFHAMRGSTRNGPIRPSSFLEEKRWPPREFISNHLKEKRVPTDNTWANSASQPSNHQISQLLNSAGTNYLMQHYNWNCRDSQRIEKIESNRNDPPKITKSTLEPKFEASNWHQVISSCKNLILSSLLFNFVFPILFYLLVFFSLQLFR